MPPPGAPQRPPDALEPPKGPRCPDPSLSAETPSSRAAAPSHLLEFAAGLAQTGCAPSPGRRSAGPTPAETKFNKFSQESPRASMARPGPAAPRGLHRLRVVQLRAGEGARWVGAVPTAEARDGQPPGSEVRRGGSGFGVRHQGAGTSGSRSGFQKCPFVMPLPGPASSPFPAPPLPPPSAALAAGSSRVPAAPA